MVSMAGPLAICDESAVARKALEIGIHYIESITKRPCCLKVPGVGRRMIDCYDSRFFDPFIFYILEVHLICPID
jgi:hypothetical protein